MYRRRLKCRRWYSHWLMLRNQRVPRRNTLPNSCVLTAVINPLESVIFCYCPKKLGVSVPLFDATCKMDLFSKLSSFILWLKIYKAAHGLNLEFWGVYVKQFLSNFHYNKYNIFLCIKESLSYENALWGQFPKKHTPMCMCVNNTCLRLKKLKNNNFYFQTSKFYQVIYNRHLMLN